MIREAADQANDAPTGIAFTPVTDLDGSSGGVEETVVTGAIQQTGSYTSIDHWELTHAGGDLTIDVFAEGFRNSGLDSQIRLFRDNGDGSFTQVAANDDGARGDDGSTSRYDSYISTPDLDAGTYVLAIGSYPLSEADALRTSTDYDSTNGFGGAYQITLTGNSTVDFAENPTYGGSWGDPAGEATVVSTIGGESALGDGTVVADVSDVTDADAGDSHTFALSDDAGGAFAIDSTTGEISVTGDPRGEGTSTDTITVVATDEAGESYSQTIGMTFGTTEDNTLTGTSQDDMILWDLAATITISGGAGDDTIIVGASAKTSACGLDNREQRRQPIMAQPDTDHYSWTAGAGRQCHDQDSTIRQAKLGCWAMRLPTISHVTGTAYEADYFTVGDFDYRNRPDLFRPKLQDNFAYVATIAIWVYGVSPSLSPYDGGM